MVTVFKLPFSMRDDGRDLGGGGRGGPNDFRDILEPHRSSVLYSSS